ncbi:MAG: tRNA lysidine(34) synthetase TilS [Clostridia bacterium]|nr:tRNA lysidine(34) synthetase TilS [Clostridia bacterium]
MENKVVETIKKYNMISENDKVIVAVSGGPDSMALLNALFNHKDELKISIFVAHVNHMIRAVADSETEYVKDFCANKGIECFVKKANVLKIAKDEKISTEEAGRNVRYAFFEEVYEKVGANKIAIAHNANDNAETVLMNIIRGTGVSGLKGIEPVRDNKYIRPLIEIERAEIEQYCDDNKLDPKYDESNNENTYTRNKIRNLLIPYIKKEFNPNIIDSINRLSDLASQENIYVEEVVDSYYKKIILEEHSKPDGEGIDLIKLDLKEFNKLDDFIKSRIVLLCVYKIFGSTKGIEKKHIKDIITLCERNIGNKFLTPNKGLKVLVNKGEVSIFSL